MPALMARMKSATPMSYMVVLRVKLGPRSAIARRRSSGAVDDMFGCDALVDRVVQCGYCKVLVDGDLLGRRESQLRFGPYKHSLSVVRRVVLTPFVGTNVATMKA